MVSQEKVLRSLLSIILYPSTFTNGEIIVVDEVDQSSKNGDRDQRHNDSKLQGWEM